MSYGFDLVRLPADVDRYEAYKQKSKVRERALVGKRIPIDPGPLNPGKEEVKQRLAAALMARHPTLELYDRNYSKTAEAIGKDEAEARRLYRQVELNEKNLWIQILLFDDDAGVSFSFTGEAKACNHAFRVVWDCLEVLESEGGFSTYDTQIDKVLDLKSDFETVLKYACGIQDS